MWRAITRGAGLVGVTYVYRSAASYIPAVSYIYDENSPGASLLEKEVCLDARRLQLTNRLRTKAHWVTCLEYIPASSINSGSDFGFWFSGPNFSFRLSGFDFQTWVSDSGFRFRFTIFGVFSWRQGHSMPILISHKVCPKSFCKSRFPHKSVNLFCITV